MSASLTWKIRRLRAMGPAEIAFRAWRAVSQRIEAILIERGRMPRPRVLVRSRLTLFPKIAHWDEAWHQLYKLDAVALGRLLAGQIDFFGGALMNVGVPPDWMRDPKTGLRAPPVFGKALDYRDDTLVGDVKMLWELGRHQHLVPLAAAYAISGDRRYRAAAVEQIESWIDTNPYALGIHWCSALEIALRLISWTIVHSLLALRDGPEGLLGAARNADALGTAIYRQAHFVRHYLSKFSSANNHLIGELTGLLAACLVFNLGEDGKAWADYAFMALEREAGLQVHGDGVNKEQASYYHLWVLEYLLFADVAAKRAQRPFSAKFSQRILDMAQFLKTISAPAGDPPAIGDADDGFVSRFTAAWPADPYDEVLAAVQVIHGVATRVKEGTLPEKAFWYAMMSGKLPTAGTETAPATWPRLFHEGGYAVLRKGDIHLVFKAGDLGYPAIAAHGHADALSFCLAIGSEWWLVDPGTYAYHSEGNWRDYFRGTAAHNTVLVNGSDQSEMGGPFLWLRHAHAEIIAGGMTEEGTQWVEGCHDGYDRMGVRHHRTVSVTADGLEVLVEDHLTGQGRHDVALHFHFHPDIEVTGTDLPNVWVARHANRGVMIITVDEALTCERVSGMEGPILGWYSPALGFKQPTSVLRGSGTYSLPRTFITRFKVAHN